jgi:hypothetical protein
MDPLRERIESAKDLIRAAERELDAALRAMQVRPRAEKTTVSQAVEGALGRLRSAKDSLVALEVPDEDEEPESSESSESSESPESPKGSEGSTG